MPPTRPRSSALPRRTPPPAHDAPPPPRPASMLPQAPAQHDAMLPPQGTTPEDTPQPLGMPPEDTPPYTPDVEAPPPPLTAASHHRCRKDSSSLTGSVPKVRGPDNKVQVQVSLRLRPLLSELDGTKEGEPPAEQVLILDGEDAGCCSFRVSRFRFAHIFGPEVTNDQVFEEHRSSILRVLRGFDCTLMAYGASGAGKTHTMMGSEIEPGVVPLAAAALFEQIATAPAGVCYSLQLSALEIVEERCVDLLHERRSVLLRVNGPGALHFHGLGEVQVPRPSRCSMCRTGSTHGRR